jgi:hypothetical protein
MFRLLFLTTALLVAACTQPGSLATDNSLRGDRPRDLGPGGPVCDASPGGPPAPTDLSPWGPRDGSPWAVPDLSPWGSPTDLTPWGSSGPTDLSP